MHSDSNIPQTRYSLSRDATIRFFAEDAVVFHAVFGNAFRCSSDLGKVLESISECGESTIVSQFENATGDSESALSTYTFLRDHCYIVPLNKTRQDTIPSEREFLLRLMVTEECNFQCDYCYENIDARSARTKPPLSIEICHNALDFFDCHFGKIEFKAIEFRIYGGEPLLQSELILQAFDAARNHFQHNAAEVLYMLNTNGSLLTLPLCGELKSRNVNVAVSLDGARKLNDAHRKYPNGSGTFNPTITGIAALLNAEVNTVVNVTVTNENINLLCDIIDMLAELGVRNISLNRLKPGPNIPEPEIAPEAYCTDFIEKVVEAYHHGRERDIWVGGLWARYLDRLVEAEARYCTACGFQMMVSPEGDVFSCPHLYGDADHVWGNVNDNTFNNLRYESYLNRIPENIPECQDCNIRGICSGGCPAVAFYSKHTLYAPESCTLHKQAVERLLPHLPED